MTRLHDLHAQGQSPWLDNLTRPAIRCGALARRLDEGVRGVTTNPTIFQKAMAASADYDGQLRSLLGSFASEEAYWELVVADVTEALAMLRPLYDESEGCDGYVSLELSPAIAHDAEASTEAARAFHERIDRPNLMVKIPATPAGVPAIRQMVSEGRDINVTLIFGLERYAEVIEAYLAGLEARQGDLSGVASVASFFLSRVDTEVDRRLGEIGSAQALELQGRAAVAQARLAYKLFRERFSGQRWDALTARGARVQRPLWASTSTKRPEYPDLLYVDSLIGPDTVTTLPEPTLDAFLDHGRVERTVDDGVDEAHATLERVEELGVDLGDVARVLEKEGVGAFAKSFDEAVAALAEKGAGL